MSNGIIYRNQKSPLGNPIPAGKSTVNYFTSQARDKIYLKNPKVSRQTANRARMIESGVPLKTAFKAFPREGGHLTQSKYNTAK